MLIFIPKCWFKLRKEIIKTSLGRNQGCNELERRVLMRPIQRKDDELDLIDKSSIERPCAIQIFQ